MIRAEVTTTNKSFTFNESTLAEAKAYTQAMIDNGVVILKVEYFDRDQRHADIRDGKF